MEILLTVGEVAPLVRMSNQGLYRAIREKQFPAIKIGSQIRIPESSLKAWVENQLKMNLPEARTSARAEVNIN